MNRYAVTDAKAERASMVLDGKIMDVVEIIMLIQSAQDPSKTKPHSFSLSPEKTKELHRQLGLALAASPVLPPSGQGH